MAENELKPCPFCGKDKPPRYYSPDSYARELMQGINKPRQTIYTYGLPVSQKEDEDDGRE